MTTNQLNDNAIKQAVREAYGARARSHLSDEPAAADACCGDDCCGGAHASAETVPMVAASDDSCCAPEALSDAEMSSIKAFYDAAETGGLPDSVTEASLGCGNPTAIAELREGETVLDLGSGGGIDCFIAAKRVGPTGRAIGVDMTPEMLALARANAAKVGADNVEFRLGEIEALPVETGTVDVIISNCVINLAPDKDRVLREAFRVLKPGGRFRVSDIVLTQELPSEDAQSLSEWAGCVAGALHRDDFSAKLAAAGFHDVAIVLEGQHRPGVHSALIHAAKPEA